MRAFALTSIITITVICVALAMWGETATTPFPLPLKHSVIAQSATDLETDMTACGLHEVMVARFSEAGFRWMYAYAPDSHVFLFVQYAGPGERALRVFIGTGEEDVVVIQRVIEDPVAALPGGPCVLLAPDPA